SRCQVGPRAVFHFDKLATKYLPIFLATLPLFHAHLVHAADIHALTGPYVSLGAGVNMPEDPALAQIIDPVPARFTFKTGWGLFGAAGYKFNNGLRPEFEVGWRKADVDQ